MNASDYLINEAKLAEALGVPRNVVKAARAGVLDQGPDWAYDVGGTGAVRFSRSGIERTLAHLGVEPQKIASLLPAPAALPPPEAPPAKWDDVEYSAVPRGMRAPFPASDDSPCADQVAADSAANETAPEPAIELRAPDVVEVTVRRTFALNRRIIAGALADGAECRVRVRCSEKLRPGMVLRCVHSADDIYELAAGERLPRYPGKR